jgi:prevent-host-death family protein
VDPVSVAEVRRHLSSLVQRVCAGERILVEHRGQPVMALVSTGDLARLEELDRQSGRPHRRELRRREQALKGPAAAPREPTDLDEIRALLQDQHTGG